MQLTRREMLKLSLLGTAALVLPMERAARTARSRPLRQLPNPFEAELPFPQVLTPVRRTATTDFYRITARQAKADILPGLSTPIWGYNGLFPGPTIKARRGRGVVVNHTNQLPVSTSVHTHGAYVDGDSDGHPNDLMQPGSSKTYYFGNDQTARTQWYHDHAMHTTASSVYKGLAGLYLIEDDFEDNLPLPKDEYDVPLVIQDRLFNSDGSFDYSEEGKASSNGVYGNVVLVNGKPWPRMAVSARKYRFRVLNGSNARAYQLALSTGDPFTVIATEGGILEEPVQLRSLPISPAERYEIIVDFSRYPVGTKMVLRNLRRRERKGAENIMRFDVVRKARDDSLVPAVLRPPEEQVDPTHLPIELSEVQRTRPFVFKRHNGYWTINRKTWDGDRIDEYCREGDAEVWEFKNTSGGWIHPVHVHLTDFKIIERNGRPPAAYEAGWKETVFLDENHSVKVLLKWPKVPEGPKPGRFVRRYPLHCHVVEHEDHDMMLQFEVAAAQEARGA